MKIVVNNKQGYKIYRNYFGRWGLRGVPSTPPGPDLTEPFYIESRGQAMDVNIEKSDSLAPTVRVEYSFDKTTWQSLGSTSTTALTINVPAGGKVWLRANTNKWAVKVAYYNYITTSTQSNVGGNIMSLLYGDTFTGQHEFPSTTISYIFSGLFQNDVTGIGNIVDASKLLLPAVTLAERCYSYMFDGCTALMQAPELPAVTLVSSCYNSMFRGCTALTQAPELPAVTLAERCYSYMFDGCTALMQAPELPATTLANYCYAYMFKNCSNLNYIKCLATDISASSCTSNWVTGVSSSGTFVKKTGASWTTGAAGIPEGWTVVEE